MRIRFSFRWIPFIAMAVVVAIGVSLGNWQLRRADEKRAIESLLTVRRSAPVLSLETAPINIDQIEYRRVAAHGEFDAEWPVYLDNRPYKGRAGFYLLMPFKIAGSNRRVLVERGWLPLDAHQRNRLPLPVTPAGSIEVDGIAVRNPGRVFQLGRPDAVRAGAILQNLSVGEFAAASRFDMLPLVVEQAGDMPDGLVRDWPLPSSGVERHYGYAFQWYALAATALLFFLVTGYRRGRK